MISEEGLTFLGTNFNSESLSEDIPVAVVTVVGKYRTGKSYFVNKLISES